MVRKGEGKPKRFGYALTFTDKESSAQSPSLRVSASRAASRAPSLGADTEMVACREICEPPETQNAGWIVSCALVEL